MGVSIIPGVVIICTIVTILTTGPSAGGIYTGAANEGIAFLPWPGDKLRFIINPLFGFSAPEAIAVPITALGSTGAAIAAVAKMAEVGELMLMVLPYSQLFVCVGAVIFLHKLHDGCLGYKRGDWQSSN